MFYRGPLQSSHLSIDISIKPNTLFTLLPLAASHSAMFTPAADNGLADNGISTYLYHLLETPAARCQPPPFLVLSCHIHLCHDYKRSHVACRRHP